MSLKHTTVRLVEKHCDWTISRNDVIRSEKQSLCSFLDVFSSALLMLLVRRRQTSTTKSSWGLIKTLIYVKMDTSVSFVEIRNQRAVRRGSGMNARLSGSTRCDDSGKTRRVTPTRTSAALQRKSVTITENCDYSANSCIDC